MGELLLSGRELRVVQLREKGCSSLVELTKALQKVELELILLLVLLFIVKTKAINAQYSH